MITLIKGWKSCKGFIDLGRTALPDPHAVFTETFCQIKRFVGAIEQGIQLIAGRVAG